MKKFNEVFENNFKQLLDEVEGMTTITEELKEKQHGRVKRDLKDVLNEIIEMGITGDVEGLRDIKYLLNKQL